MNPGQGEVKALTRQGISALAVVRGRFGGSNSKPLFASALAALIIASFAMGWVHYTLKEEMQHLAMLQSQSLSVQQQKEKALIEVELAQTAEQLLRKAKDAGFDPVKWTEMRVNLKQYRMTRPDANKLLAYWKNKPGSIFGADRFDISVTQPDESLFERPSKSDSELLMSMQGRNLIRIISSENQK